MPSVHLFLRDTSRRASLAARVGVVTLATFAAAGSAASADVADNVDTGGLRSLSGSYLAARHAGTMKDLESAAAFYRRALDADPENEVLLDRTVMLLVASGALPQAVELADDLAASDPTNQLAALTLTVDALANGDPVAARDAMTPLSTGSPLPELTAALLEAWSYAAEENYDRALLALDSLEGPDWYSTFTTLHSGLIADFAGRHDDAIERLAAAYEADPRAIRVLDAYARALARADKLDEAKAVVANFIAEGGDHPLVQQLSDALSSGEPVAPQITSAQAGAAEALYGLGIAVGQEGGQEYAASYLQLALHLKPDTELAAFSLAALYEGMNQHDKAITVYRTIPDASPLARTAKIQIGLNLNAEDKLDEAKTELQALVDANPTDLSAILALGNVLRSDEDFEAARTVYGQGIETLDEPQREHWTLFYFRGIANERTDHWPEAEADFRKALELYPDQPLVLNYLGYSLIDKHMKIDEAVEMIRTAVSQRPDDGFIVDSLGWAYYRLGRYDEAVAELERAVELMPNDPVINDHLGDAYWQVGRKLEAMFQWSHARDMDPEPKDLAKIKTKLEHGLQPDKTDAASVTNDETPR
ncbi:tetratricopeptide repeat protein [Amorphus sp. 3PC139-8]|uniref:tetratricopeptide repeat protein n=1 Tax=Amorphus sp. 3PC139-8 TaxID=2735676 RepID=UPI00345D7398